MEYLRIAPDLDSDPDIEAAGWVGARVFELVLRVSALKDLRGRIPAQLQSPAWLARRWNLTPADLPGIAPEALVASGIKRLLDVGLLVRDGDALVIRSWEKFYKSAKSGAERQANYIARSKCHGDGGDDSASPVTQVTPPRHARQNDATPPNTTPLHTTKTPPPPPVREPAAVPTKKPAVAAADEQAPGLRFWKWAQVERELLTFKKAEKPPPPAKLERWYARAMADERVGGDEKRLRASYMAYLHDLKFGVDSGKAFNVFMSDGWERDIPADEPPAAPVAAPPSFPRPPRPPCSVPDCDGLRSDGHALVDPDGPPLCGGHGSMLTSAWTGHMRTRLTGRGPDDYRAFEAEWLATARGPPAPEVPSVTSENLGAEVHQ